MKIFRFTRVMFGLTASPFLRQATLRHHLAMFQKEVPTLVEQVISSLYVDELASGVDVDDETFLLYTELKDRFSARGFNMRKFLTNSASLQRRIDEAEGVKQLEPATAPEEACEDDGTYARVSVNNQPPWPHALDSFDKVLGVASDRKADDIVIDIAACFSAVSDRPTKRGVASQVARLFDPLGLVSPLTVRLKLFLQQLHTTGLDWDERLSSNEEQQWNSLLQSVLRAAPVRVPRCYFILVPGAKVSLHGFSDASNVAFAAAVNLRTEAEDVAVQLAMAKKGVAPKAKQTIPRLEFLAAMTQACLMHSVQEALLPVLPVDNIYCWSDSQVSLGWI